MRRGDPRYAQHLDGEQNGFLLAQEGKVEIQNSVFKNSLSSKGLIQLTDDVDIDIAGSSFSRIIGVA